MNINREEFLKQLEAVLSGLSSRELVEQSSCFVFIDGRVYTYNDEVACYLDTCLNVTGAIPASPLIGILKKLKEEELQVNPGDGELTFKGKNRKFSIRMEAEILLPIESIEKPKIWKDLPEDFANGVGMVAHCAGSDDTQFELTCIHFTPKWMEACDNTQAARFRTDLPVKTPTLIRKTSLKNIVFMGMNEVSETKNWIHFRNPVGLVFSCRRYLEEYPKLGAMFKVEGQQVTFPKGLKDAAEKAEIFSAENAEDNSVLIQLQPGKIRLTGTGVSGSYVEIKKVKYTGKPFSFRIPPSLLRELIKRHNTYEITQNRLKIKIGKLSYISALDQTEE
jgi:hypothetical protein